MEKNRTTKLLKLLAKVVITTVCVYYVVNKVDFEEVLQSAAKTNVWWLIPATFSFILSKIISAYRLKVFFDNAGIIVSNTYNLKLYLLGMYYNLFLPGGVGGDAYKVYKIIKRKEAKFRPAASAIFVDRGNGLLMIGILSVLMAVVVDVPKKLQEYASWQPALLLTIPMALIAYYFVVKGIAKSLNKQFFTTNLLSFLTQVTQVMSVIFIMWSIDIYDNYVAYIFLFLVSSIVIIVPVSIGGLGLREITFFHGAQLFLLDEPSAVLISFIFYILSLIVSLFGIYYSIHDKALDSDGFL